MRCSYGEEQARTIFNTAFRLFGKNDEEVKQFFLTKTEEIPGKWSIALNRAEAHNDIEAAYIEKVKLEAAAKIKNTFRKIWEERE